MPDTKLANIRACVFDAYGTLFDVNSAAEQVQDMLGDKWRPLADMWRTKQLQYTWLRSLTGRHADFWDVTGDALDFALESLKVTDAGLRQRLLDLYLQLRPYPEVESTLVALKASGLRCGILSNGSAGMLSSAVNNAGIGHLLDAVLSVDEAGIFKPHPSVYQMAVDQFGLMPSEICFVSSNGWDAYSAKAFGFRVIWCNRFAQPAERIPDTPDGEIINLSELLGIVGAR
ncbi:haloacid dehalogenase type II [Glaciimonas sp. Gout2]|uniref:haloacid dehalogenase type II n=1 Tax=unclassified Glaciimonas TaxID=2644401 RepID=UPI002B22950D|nr:MULTISPECIES: haloacid dehalogenase type II [unclassified Glaciimonas]MEB0011123.1 haloacid dehalogenase type II [Glaciimonas sp. Cout2]MEB0081199.1 haloacid dehalogenase type II [Glaciimonas sp. Gout2]